MDLAYVSFENLNLAYADFTGSWFYWDVFIGSDLRGAVFDDAAFLGGNLSPNPTSSSPSPCTTRGMR